MKYFRLHSFYEGTKGIIRQVTFDGCDATPCTIVTGTSIHGTLRYESEVNVDELECEMFGIIGGQTVPFPGGCQNVYVSKKCVSMSEKKVS